MNGLTFRELQKELKKLGNNSDLHVTYGTRTKKFYLIDSSDRDYNYFDVTIEQARHLKQSALIQETSKMVIYTNWKEW